MSAILDYCSSADLPLRSFEAGEVIMQRDIKDGAIYVLKSGSVEVQHRGVEISRTATPGTVFGEIAVMLDTAHTATAVAEEACEFYVAADGEAMLRENEDMLREIARTLAYRLVKVSERVVDLHDRLELLEEEDAQFSGVLRGLVDQMG